MNEKRKRPMTELLKETKETSKYIKDQGYHLVEIYECQWRRINKTNSQVQQFLNSKVNRTLDHQKTDTKPERNLEQTRPIGFHEPTLQNTKLMTRELQVYLRKSGQGQV